MKISRLRTFEQGAKDFAIPITHLRRWVNSGLIERFVTSDGHKYVRADDIADMKHWYEMSQYVTLQEVSSELDGETKRVQERENIDYPTAQKIVLTANIGLRRLYHLVLTKVEGE